MELLKQYWGLTVGGILTIVFAIVFIVMALADWPDLGYGYDTCYAVQSGVPVDKCYCETLRPGKIKQPANTWSDLGFIITGLIILAIAGRENGRSTRSEKPNPMNTGRYPSVLFGLVVFFMGPGSMMFHASMKAWGGFIDSTSMFLLLAFLIGYDLQQITRLPAWLCWLIGIGILALFMVLTLFMLEYATVLFLIMVLVTLCVEVPLWLGFFSVKRDVLPLSLFGGTFLIALLIWFLSKTGKPLCFPDSILFQGHAYWHLLNAVALGFLFWYLRSESGGRPLEE